RRRAVREPAGCRLGGAAVHRDPAARGTHRGAADLQPRAAHQSSAGHHRVALRRPDLWHRGRVDGAARGRRDPRDGPLPAPARGARAMAHPGAAADLMVTPTLQARSLSKHFGERVALTDVSFQLASGEILAVIGPNGAGKTTLLSLLAGAATPSGGEVLAPAGERIGWVPQQTAVYSKLSVLENLRLFARLERVADPEAAVAAMLEQTGLGDRANEQLGRLSGGNRQRVNIAIGLLAQPAVALL